MKVGKLDPRNPDVKAELEAQICDQACWDQFADEGTLGFDARREFQRSLLRGAVENLLFMMDDEKRSFTDSGGKSVRVNGQTGLFANDVVRLDLPGDDNLIEYIAS